MFLYFPSLKIVKLDSLPSGFILYLKSNIISPKHYPKHPLIDGKLEFVGKIANSMINTKNNHNKTPITKKGEFISVIIEFNENPKPNSPAISLISYGFQNDKAKFFLNSTENQSLYESLFLDYFLKVNETKEKKKLKI